MPDTKRRVAKANRKRYIDESLSESESGEVPARKRGRKKQKDEDYISGANEKIEKLKQDYKKAQASNATAA
jgi:hypothetical protein